MAEPVQLIRGRYSGLGSRCDPHDDGLVVEVVLQETQSAAGDVDGGTVAGGVVLVLRREDSVVCAELQLSDPHDDLVSDIYNYDEFLE